MPAPIAKALVGIILATGVVAVIVFYIASQRAPQEIVVDVPLAPAFVQKVIGRSSEGRAIEAYTFGSGERHVLFVGGMHGGYEWNSIVLAYEFIDYLKANPSLVPSNMRVSVIPNVNPDGTFQALQKEGRFALSDVPSAADLSHGRFNAHGVDLNRNFDCKWQPDGSWRGKEVSAGSAPFSEAESRVLRDFVLAVKLAGVVFWHSQANAVYASECEAGILPETLVMMRAYAEAAGYPAVESFDAYTVTGDAEGWLASIGIPAITVELSTHETVEWEKNLLGTKALLDYYGK